MFKKRAKHLLEAVPADAILISSPENQQYFSGFTGGEAVLVLQKDKLTLFTDSRYFVQVKEEAPDYTLLDITKTKPTAYLQDFSPKTIAFEEDFVSAKAAKLMADALPDSRWLGIDSEIMTQRSIKDETELACIRQAATLADDAFHHILPLLRPGTCERDIALELEWFMRKQGATGASFPIICASGYRSAMPHGVASDKLLENGDFVTLDFGCFYKGYASDMTRTVVLGKADAEQKKIYETVLSAQMAALDCLQAGITGKEADSVARNIIKKASYGDAFGHSLGHGVGLQIHEQPNLSPRSETVLRPGAVVSVEPGIYIENFGGVRIEDLVIITENGHENMTHSEKKLLEL